MRHIFNDKDVMAILPTGFGKCLIFQLFVTMCGVRSKRQRGICFSGIIVISLLQGIIQSIVRLGRQIQHGKNSIRKIQDKKFTTPPERSCLKLLAISSGSLKSKILSDFVQLATFSKTFYLRALTTSALRSLCFLIEWCLQLLANSCYTIVAL